jgi:hypothetical protein
VLDSHDEQRLNAALARLTGPAEENLFPRLAGDAATENVSEHLTFDHIATLVFPDTVQDVQAFLSGVGVDVGPPVTSVVVRGRLARRYGVPEQDLDVTIAHGYLPGADRVGIEVFVLPRAIADRVHHGIIARERRTEAESHSAWAVNSDGLAEVWRTCRERLRMLPDGGGYNPLEDEAAGGRTVLYFKVPPEISGAGRVRRVELACAGHQSYVLAAHRASRADALDERTALLSILAGHWAARAVHVAVETGLADVLHQRPLSAAGIAEQAGCDPAAVTRLLRYLHHLGLVRQLEDSTYINTEMGDLLRTDNPFSDLVRLYGSEFYHAWGKFAAAIQTGRTAFRHHYGGEHFDYFASHPASARQFDRAMQAVADAVAEGLTSSYALPAGAAVIDVGGGNGAMLKAILRDNPDVSGTVFDREHVLSNSAAEDQGTPHRHLRSVAGDFFAEVPAGGDVYLLSRVLHDWSDEDCARILQNCRRACRAGATMLVMERLLSNATAPSPYGKLAASWDMQMLAVTGGQERGLAEYEKLLLNAGFRVVEVKPLPVELNLLVATAI